MRRPEAQMKKWMRDLLVVAMLSVLSTGAFAQKPKDDGKRPPKEPSRVVTPDKGRDRPPPNNNQGKPKDNKGRPHD